MKQPFKKELTQVELQALQSVSIFMGIHIDIIKLQIFGFFKTKKHYLFDYRNTNDPTLEALAVRGLEETRKTKEDWLCVYKTNYDPKFKPFDFKLEALAIKGLEKTCETKEDCRWLFNSINDFKLEALAVQKVYQLTLQELQPKT